MDQVVFRFFYNFAGQSSYIDGIILAFAKYLPYLLVFGGGFFLLTLKPWRKRIFAAIFSVLTLLVSRGFITEWIRYFYNRERPFKLLDLQPLFVDSHSSFPSGHAAFFFALAFTIFYFNKKFGYWFIFLAFLNSLGRIAAGVHWPTDILGGIAVALFSFWLVKNLLPSPNYAGEISKEKESPIQ